MANQPPALSLSLPFSCVRAHCLPISLALLCAKRARKSRLRFFAFILGGTRACSDRLGGMLMAEAANQFRGGRGKGRVGERD